MSDENFGTELRRLRMAAGFSLTELSDKIHYTKGYLSKVENGIAPPNATLAALCDAELRTGGTLSAQVPRRRRKIKTRTFTLRPAGLPPATPFFVGRSVEIAEIDAILRGTRPGSPAVCAVDGFAGSGKTALAVHAARQVLDEFSDGVLYVDMHAYTPGRTELDGAQALDSLLRQLGMPADEIPRSVDERAVLYRGCLHGRRLLIMIDNVRTADQVLLLVPGESGCRMLLTSRNRLVALDDAHHVSLGPLTDDEAVVLFTDVAGPGRIPGDAEGRRVLTDALTRCGGLPLAVRIAAARYQHNLTWTPADLAERLGDRDALSDELADGSRSVYGAFRLSYQELLHEQRDLLVYLTLYPGADFDAYVAGALVDEAMPRARRLVEQLQTGHLVTALPGGRFRCHDLVRSFADKAGRVDVAAEHRAAALGRLVDYALTAAESADRHVAPGRFHPTTSYDHRPPSVRSFTDAASATAWFDIEWPALAELVTVAATNNLADRAWRLAFLLRDYFFNAKLWDVWVHTHEVALSSAREVGDRWAEAVTLNNLGVAHVDQGDVEKAEACFRSALPLFRELGDEQGQVTTSAHLGWAHYYQGEYETALCELSMAVEFYQRVGNDRNVAITLRGRALTETELGNYTASIGHATEALALAERTGLSLDAVMALNCLGWTYFRCGQHDLAAVTYRQAIGAAQRANNPYEVARAMTGLGNIAAATDNLAEAQRWWDDAEEHHPDLNTITVGESRVRRAATPVQDRFVASSSVDPRHDV